VVSENLMEVTMDDTSVIEFFRLRTKGRVDARKML
jgi:hypothetical protein